MRIISGRLRGRTFNSPQTTKTHPMSDKIRGALFNILGDIEGLSVLDAFAGSGAISFEAVSRGAAEVMALDNDASAQRTIQDNIVRLQLNDKVRLIKTSASTWLQTHRGTVFDIVVCDPPYDDLQLPLLTQLADCLAQKGIFVLSLPRSTSLPDFDRLQKIVHRTYGDAQLVFYR